MQEMETLVPMYVEEPVWAVVGASNDRAKYGNRIYLKLKDAGYRVYPVNRREHMIEGDPAYATLFDLPEPPAVVNMVVPPHEAPSVVQQAKEIGAKVIWFQPGAESAEAIHWARKHGLDVSRKLHPCPTGPPATLVRDELRPAVSSRPPQSFPRPGNLHSLNAARGREWRTPIGLIANFKVAFFPSQATALVRPCKTLCERKATE